MRFELDVSDEVKTRWLSMSMDERKAVMIEAMERHLEESDAPRVQFVDGLAGLAEFFERANEWSPSVRLTRREFDKLPEYSCSIPTGTTIGKRWKRSDTFTLGRPRDRELVWHMGEYIDHPDPELIGIRWKRIEIADE